MTELTTKSLEYSSDGDRLVGYFAAEPGVRQPGLILVHDAHGVSPAMQAAARHSAELGYAVLLADLWGDGKVPEEDEVGTLIGSMVGDHQRWMARLQAAQMLLLDQPEVDGTNIAACGYCFGGSSVLEYARAGGDVKGVACFHPGLDTVSTDWDGKANGKKVLIMAGAEDPFAPPAAVGALEESLSRAGADWEVDIYGGTKHAFTDPNADKAGRPDVIAYNARAAQRAWDAFTFFLAETFDSGDDDA